VKQYEYVGSWADNLVDFTEANNMQTFEKQCKHMKQKCLYCKIKYAPFDDEGRSSCDFTIS